MHEIFSAAFGESLFTLNPWAVLARIAAAALLGGAVAWIHSKTVGAPAGTGFAMQSTLVLLAALIAMVTQVIGDNVARAFSLVGALSIVRFRTVVRDTRDTAFVIFSVAVGMAIGAQAPWAALMGVLVIGVTAYLLSKLAPGPIAGAVDEEGGGFMLMLRTQPDWDLEGFTSAILDRHLSGRRLHSIRASKQRASVDHLYSVCVRADGSPQELIKILNRIEGVQEVRFFRQGADEESSKT